VCVRVAGVLCVCVRVCRGGGGGVSEELYLEIWKKVTASLYLLL
jgi:hypothetical protein